ncbi:MAG: dual specificity protein phosphatase [Myxococcaceae bacterium]|nr:dual specificity protein phosphatase [Myxococcaceae bacterium]
MSRPHPFCASWLSPNLAVGGSLSPEVIPLLRQEHGIGFVVDLRSEQQDDRKILQQCGVQLLSLPTDDHCAVSETMLRTGVAWVREQLAQGQRVYIHCEHGIGRSVLLAWCVLVALGEGPRDALVRIKAARSIASPSPAQIHALLAFARDHERELPSWDELAEIAYAHLRAPGAEAESA